MSTATLTAALLHPLLTVACGDDANTLALVHRAMRRDIDVEVTTVHGEAEIPSCDIYFLGGSGQSGVQQVAELLAASNAFTDRVGSGAVVLAVDAGMDALGRGLVDERGQILAPGLGVLGFTSARGPLQDGAVVTRPAPDLRLPAMTGWVQHRVALRPDPGVEPFVELDVGHSDRGSHDGVLAGHIIGTRLHGPILGRNPEVADLMIAWATGREVAELPPLPEGPQERAREVRIAEDRATQPVVRRGWRRGTTR